MNVWFKKLFTEMGERSMFTKLLNDSVYSVYSVVQVVAVGMLVAQHPPHRSLRAELPHKAPASGYDAKRSGG